MSLINIDKLMSGNVSDLDKYRKIHAQVISNSGGLVTGDIFVTKTGVMITKRSQLTDKAKSLFDILNIDQSATDSEQHAEFNSRLTYLSFKNKKTDSSDYNHKMIHEYGHRSVYNDEVVTLLIAGCSVETMLEFIAHNEAKVARLTS